MQEPNSIQITSFPRKTLVKKLLLHWEGEMQDDVIVKKRNQKWKPSDCQDADKNILTKPMFALAWYDVNKNKQYNFFYYKNNFNRKYYIIMIK